ncbi:MAG: acyltransferase [Hyphomonadaceae bacterium]
MPANLFTPLRICLALMVACEHMLYLQMDRPTGFFELGQISLANIAVNAFFVISGYLITASAVNRRSVGIFAKARALRILPALLVNSLIVVFLIAPLFSTLPPLAYYTSSETWLFAPKVVSFIDPYPAIAGAQYAHTSFSDLNGPIWTLRYEVLAYIGTGLLLAFGMASNRRLMIGLLALTGLIFAVSLQGIGNGFLSGSVGDLLRFSFCYLLGANLYLWRDVFTPKPIMALAGLAFGATLLLSGLAAGELIFDTGLAIGILALAFAPLSVSQKIRKLPDISYGLYIWHWPIYMLLINTFPDAPRWQMLALVGLPLAICAAMASWFLIEKPTLALKTRKTTARRKPTYE